MWWFVGNGCWQEWARQRLVEWQVGGWAAWLWTKKKWNGGFVRMWDMDGVCETATSEWRRVGCVQHEFKLIFRVSINFSHFLVTFLSTTWVVSTSNTFIENYFLLYPILTWIWSFWFSNHSPPSPHTQLSISSSDHGLVYLVCHCTWLLFAVKLGTWTSYEPLLFTAFEAWVLLPLFTIDFGRWKEKSFIFSHLSDTKGWKGSEKALGSNLRILRNL